MLDASYHAAHSRVAALAAGLDDGQLRTPVPATPSWTVHEVLAHLVGGAADVAAGRLDGAPGDEWTGRHVEERRSRPVHYLLEEWDAAAPAVVSSLMGQQFHGPNSAADLIVHEADLREALGLGRTAREHWQQPYLETMMKVLGRQLERSAPVLVRDETGQEWCCGSGDPEVQLTADGYELFRGLFSRRSRRQIAAWNWSPTATEQMIDAFGVFGHRDDDQPIPVA